MQIFDVIQSDVELQNQCIRITHICFSAVDYDSGQISFTLIIGATSRADTVDIAIYVEVTPVNEHTPEFNTPGVTRLPENVAIGTTISSLVATDEDSPPHGLNKYVLSSG